jgi:hypothetical protein
MKNGNICTKAKTKERCSNHPLAKYPASVDDLSKAESMMEHIFRAEAFEPVSCPCGKTIIKWNYAHHCSFPKHKAWSKLMPEPKKIKSWIADGSVLGGFK